MESPESTEEQRYCHVCGVDLLPRTTEHVIGVHVDCAARVQQRSLTTRSPSYGWRRKAAEAHG